jgi:hypothetical protein
MLHLSRPRKIAGGELKESQKEAASVGGLFHSKKSFIAGFGG